MAYVSLGTVAITISGISSTRKNLRYIFTISRQAIIFQAERIAAEP
jgi:hypothetical protein